MRDLFKKIYDKKKRRSLFDGDTPRVRDKNRSRKNRTTRKLLFRD